MLLLEHFIDKDNVFKVIGTSSMITFGYNKVKSLVGNLLKLYKMARGTYPGQI